VVSKKKPEPRDLMQKAVAVMLESIAEDRPDKKASPKVGAVLLKSDGTIDTAARGELRYGDHAEFTLLERKNRSQKLDGSILFATLEPCAPGSRKHPKLCCAERIVNARIKEVWVGIEDPDPTVDRKGILYLQEHGIVVHMFDRDLQEKIREENKEFIDGALERKAAAEEKEKTPVVLSKLEASPSAVDMGSLSPQALEAYRAFSKSPDDIKSPSFQRRLVQQGLLVPDGNALAPSGFGMLLFGESPRDSMPQAGVLGTIHYPDGREEVQDFAGPALLIPDAVTTWLKDKLPNPIDRRSATRRDAVDPFYELVREGVVNALVHRDYDVAGAKCQLQVTPDTVAIRSPGEPVSPITLQQLQTFEAPMLSRNPVLHYVFAKAGLAEERGLGLKSMREKAAAMGLPQPKYEWAAPYLTLTLYRTPAAAAQALDAGVRKKLKGDELAAWEFIVSRPEITSAELQEQMEFDERKAQRVLKALLDAKALVKLGAGRSTRYKAVL
jgi:ATP-dependent DNA helicase RecG